MIHVRQEFDSMDFTYMPRHINATGLQSIVNSTTVLQQLLFFEVVDQKGFAERHVLLRLFEGVSLAKEGNEYVDDRPLFNRLLQNAVVPEKDDFEFCIRCEIYIKPTMIQ